MKILPKNDHHGDRDGRPDRNSDDRTALAALHAQPYAAERQRAQRRAIGDIARAGLSVDDGQRENSDAYAAERLRPAPPGDHYQIDRHQCGDHRRPRRAVGMDQHADSLAEPAVGGNADGPVLMQKGNRTAEEHADHGQQHHRRDAGDDQRRHRAQLALARGRALPGLRLRGSQRVERHQRQQQPSVQIKALAKQTHQRHPCHAGKEKGVGRAAAKRPALQADIEQPRAPGNQQIQQQRDLSALKKVPNQC